VIALVEDALRLCGTCRKQLPLSEFYLNRRKHKDGSPRIGMQSHCKRCQCLTKQAREAKASRRLARSVFDGLCVCGARQRLHKGGTGSLGICPAYFEAGL